MTEPFSPQGWPAEDVADPYPIYRRYRTADPVHQAAPGTWYVLDHDHVTHTLSHRNFGRAMPAHLPGRNNALRRSVENWLVFLDPPRHTRLRRLLTAEFSPKVVADLRPRIAAIAGDLLRPLTARHELDLVREFAAPLPVLVISALLGVPASLHGWFRARAQWLWEQAVFVVDRGSLPEVGVAASGVVAVRPAERGQPRVVLAAPGPCALKGFAFERGVQAFRCGVVGRAADRAHGLDHPGLLAGLGERGEVYWAPWSLWKIAPARLPRVRSAACRALMTSSVRMWSAIAQPARRREHRSMTVAR